MKQNYQTIDAAVTALAVPEGVSVALGEIVADVQALGLDETAFRPPRPPGRPAL